MKKSLIVLLAINLTACGIAEDIGKNCGGTFEGFCTLIFGENSTDIKDLDRR